MTSTHLDEISAIIRRVEAEAYERGKSDAKREILQHLTSMDAKNKAPEEVKEHVDVVASGNDYNDSIKPAHERQRAPKGIVPKFVSSVLTDEPGLTPTQILSRASTEFEKMIKPASVRSELRSGANLGKYKSENGIWSMVDKHFDEAEETPSKEESSASNSSHERTKDASSVTRSTPSID